MDASAAPVFLCRCRSRKIGSPAADIRRAGPLFFAVFNDILGTTEPAGKNLLRFLQFVQIRRAAHTAAGAEHAFNEIGRLFARLEQQQRLAAFLRPVTAQGLDLRRILALFFQDMHTALVTPPDKANPLPYRVASSSLTSSSPTSTPLAHIMAYSSSKVRA